jgi:heme-degrading monooxygenase HmoA
VPFRSHRPTAYVIVWRFRPLAGREGEFEDAYGPTGDWALLFRQADGYLGTELLRDSDDPREYITLDRWISRAAYETFLARFDNEYRQLDDRLEGLTEEETLLGTFEALPT